MLAGPQTPKNNQCFSSLSPKALRQDTNYIFRQSRLISLKITIFTQKQEQGRTNNEANGSKR